VTNYAGILFTIVATVFLPIAAIFERRAQRKPPKPERYAAIQAEYRGIAGINRNRKHP